MKYSVLIQTSMSAPVGQMIVQLIVTARIHLENIHAAAQMATQEQIVKQVQQNQIKIKQLFSSIVLYQHIRGFIQNYCKCRAML